MITTLTALCGSLASRRLCRSAIVAVLVFLLAGCSAVRLGYGNGPQLVWWWLDGYLDFPAPQVPSVKASIDRWFEWHRSTQLPDYVVWLASLRAQANDDHSAAQFCRWNTDLRNRLEPSIDRALLLGADLLPVLGEAQFRHLEQRYLKNLDEMRAEYLQPDAAERRSASVKRAIDRVEQIYGRLGEAQRKVIADGVATSPFDPQAWMEERQRRQRDTVLTLRRLAADKAERDARLAALRVLVERSERSPDPAYRDYQRRLVDYNCDFAARIHNATTPAQRQKARETLKGWEDDLRSLLATANPSSP
jgi:hypothetical protein